MPTDPIATLLEEIRVALEGKQVQKSHTVVRKGHAVDTWKTELILDPAYNKLRELLAWMMEERWDGYQSYMWVRPLPSKALEGALIGAVADFPVEEETRLTYVLYSLMQEKGDTKVQALTAVLEWLKGERMNTSRHKGSAAERVRE